MADLTMAALEKMRAKLAAAARKTGQPLALKGAVRIAPLPKR